jgi:TolB-like protein
MPQALSGGGPALDPGAGLKTGPVTKVVVNGREVPVRRLEGQFPGYLLPDGQGGYIWMTDGPAAPANPSNTAARELKLKVRELADQLLAGMSNQDLRNLVAMPVSFVNQDDFEVSSSFGRYLTEQMFYEFNQRGFPIREYRAEPDIATRRGQGDFVLSRKIQNVFAQNPYAVLLAGTYYQDNDNVFVNARLVRAMDGLVLRTGMLVFAQTDVTRRMLANTGPRVAPTFVGMKDYETMTSNTALTSIDLGDDLH